MLTTTCLPDCFCHDHSGYEHRVVVLMDEIKGADYLARQRGDWTESRRLLGLLDQLRPVWRAICDEDDRRAEATLIQAPLTVEG